MDPTTDPPESPKRDRDRLLSVFELGLLTVRDGTVAMTPQGYHTLKELLAEALAGGPTRDVRRASRKFLDALGHTEFLSHLRQREREYLVREEAEREARSAEVRKSGALELWGEPLPEDAFVTAKEVRQ
ncbi:MAG: hypothetical protein ACRDUY_08180 [Nitriliruptorales bacterium]